MDFSPVAFVWRQNYNFFFNTTSLLDTAACILSCFQSLLPLLAFFSKRYQQWKSGGGYKVGAALWNKPFCGQQLKSDKSRKAELSVWRPGRLRSRSQVGPEFLHIPLHCSLTKNIFWNRECRHLALDFPNSHCVQCIFLLMKAEQVPLIEQIWLFCGGEYRNTLNVRSVCWSEAGKLLR